MLKDILIPSKIGDSYLFSKRILSFEITHLAVHALLIVCKGNKVIIQNKMSIVLKDYSTTAVVGAIKKIVSTIGAYDEIVTSLSSGSIVFKELQLPFIGYEKLEMIIAYEVEALLPFALDQAVIDFMVTDENVAQNSSTVLVAAALKQDVDIQLGLFEKAGVLLQLMTVDMFALYTLYQKGLYPDRATPIVLPKKKFIDFFKKSKGLPAVQAPVAPLKNNGKIDMFVDIGFDGMKILYVSSGVLKSVRAVPYGVYDIAQSLSKKLEISYYDVMQKIIYKEHPEQYDAEVQVELRVLFEHIARTISFFANQIKDDYKKPQQIIFSGQGCSLAHFIKLAQSFFDMPVTIVALEPLCKSLHIVVADKKPFPPEALSNLATALFGKYNNNCNLLKSFAHKSDNALLYKQLGMVVLLTVGCIGGILWHSISELQRWDRAYAASKKELTTSLQTIMGIDVKGEKRLQDIVDKAEKTLKAERNLWFSFSKQTEQSYLKYLQDLTTHIDRESLGLDLKKLSMRPDIITMTGSLSGNKDSEIEDGFAALPVFKEELLELNYLQLVQEARSPELFTIQLKTKEKGPHDID